VKMEATVFKVKHFNDLKDFEKGLNDMDDRGWELHSWQDQGEDGFFIVAVFKRPRSSSVIGGAI
jgi:hypothetical protein